MKNVKRNSIIILIITLGILYYLLHDNFIPIMEQLRKANVLWIIVTFIVYIIYFMLDQLALFNIVKEFNKKIKYRFILRLGLITKFFNGITPLATGGQPMQVYELHKKDVSVSNGTNIVIQNYIVFQIALVFLGVVAVVLNQIFNFFAEIPVLKQLTVIGFVLNFGILALLLLVGFSKNFNKNVVTGVIKFLAKIKIVKDKEKTTKNWEVKCSEYYENTQVLVKHKRVLVSGVFFQIISLALSYALPYFIALAIGCAENLNLANVITAGCYIYIMGCYVPIPGASGGMEFAFLGFFGNFITNPKLAAVLLLWRFVTYYLPTIVGAVVFNVNPTKIPEDAKLENK